MAGSEWKLDPAIQAVVATHLEYEEAGMAEPVYPALDSGQEGEKKLGFDGLVDEPTGTGTSYAVQFTPSDPKEQLTDAAKPTYRTFDGDHSATHTSEEINLIEREHHSSPTEEERVSERVLRIMSRL